uniref:Uncharacterized protein n=1 Tax=Utricularia reniformis TaxID=192314 RepID=A0A1Y0AZT8_9LAMI|nr:hypothetical protein AEK19_MT0410 [Utricularia reniformis]ART30677.1 hypothetical protein AEK19_MT0410 [Utricularia reniformis]
MPPSQEVHPLSFRVCTLWSECTLLRAQMAKWLRYLHWYWNIELDLKLGADPMVILKRLLDPPVVITSWRIPKSDPELVRCNGDFMITLDL